MRREETVAESTAELSGNIGLHGIPGALSHVTLKCTEILAVMGYTRLLLAAYPKLSLLNKKHAIKLLGSSNFVVFSLLSRQYIAPLLQSVALTFSPNY